MRKTRVFLSFALFLALAACQKPEPEAAKPPPVATVEKITLCRHTTMLLPLLVAEKRDFYSGVGLAVTVREFTVGRDALEALLRGECDLATATEPPVAEYALKRDDFRILTALQNSDNQNRLVARAERGIATAADLRGKRIATIKGTSFHYFLELFLAKNGIDTQELTILFMKGDELLRALTSGEVDAIVINNKIIAEAQQILGDRTVVLEAPGLCRNYAMILATVGLLERRAGIAGKFLRALARAEEFIEQNPVESGTIAQEYLKVSPATITKLLGFYHYRLSLDQAMLMGLEETARWTLQQNGAHQPLAPNFLHHLIDAKPLRAVRPAAITIEQ